MKKIINILEKRIDQHKNSMLVTVVSRSGSAPGREGAVMLVGEDGYITGTIGGGMMFVWLIWSIIVEIKNKKNAVANPENEHADDAQS